MTSKTQQDVLSRIGLHAQQMRQAIRVCIVATRGAIVLGSPGGGKTSLVRGEARSVDAEFQASPPLPTMDPTDLRGLPKVVEVNGILRTVCSVPDFLPLEQPKSKSGIGVYLHDDFPTAPPAVQAPFYQLWLEGHLGNYQMPSGWVQFATGNYDTDRAGAHRTLTPMRSRWVTLHLVSNVDVFVDDSAVGWQVSSPITLPTLPPRPRLMHPMVRGFVRFKPELLNRFSPDALSYPCERSWEIVSDLMYAVEALGGVEPVVEHALIAGTIGVGESAEFIAYQRHHRALDIDEILRNPKKAHVPKEPAALWAVSASLSARADAKNIGAVVTYIDRIPKEFQVFCIRAAARRDGTIGRTKDFIDWANSTGRGVVL